MRKGFLSLELLLLTFFFIGVSQAFASDWQGLKAKALELAIAGEDDNAHIAYEQTINKAKDQFGQSAPFIGELYFEMGEMDLAAKKFSWADDSLTQACRLMPNSQSAHLKLAELLLVKDSPGLARAQASIILQKHRECRAARQLVAFSYQRQGNGAKAVKEFYNSTLGSAAGPILVPAAVSSATSASESKQIKQQDKTSKASESKEQTTLLPGNDKALMPAKPQASSLLKIRQRKYRESENALMPEPVITKAAAKEKVEPHKGKVKARSKITNGGQTSKAASSKVKARTKLVEPKVMPLKAKAVQLKAKQKSVSKGLVPPPPPMVPVFGGIVPPPSSPVESHVKSKEKPKETAKESTKESSKALSKEAGGKEQTHNPAAGEGSDFLLDWAGSKKKGN